MTAASPMVDFYEETAALGVSAAKRAEKVNAPFPVDSYEEYAAEMLSLANLARRGGIPEAE